MTRVASENDLNNNSVWLNIKEDWIMVWSPAQSSSENSPSWMSEANSLSVAGVNQKRICCPRTVVLNLSSHQKPPRELINTNYRTSPPGYLILYMLGGCWEIAFLEHWCFCFRDHILRINEGEEALKSRDAFLGLNHRKEAENRNTPPCKAETDFSFWHPGMRDFRQALDDSTR